MDTFQAFMAKVSSEILAPIITLMVLGAFVVFVYGVVMFIAGAANEEKRKIGQLSMLWGIIGLSIMFAANGIVRFIQATSDALLK